MDQNDDRVDALRYTVEMRVDPAALAAMVAATGIDMGLKRGLQFLNALGVVGVAAALLGSRMAPSVGGWFATAALLIGILAGHLWLMWRRWGMQLTAGRLIDRFGAARFRASQPVIDQANRYLDEA